MIYRYHPVHSWVVTFSPSMLGGFDGGGLGLRDKQTQYRGKGLSGRIKVSVSAIMEDTSRDNVQLTKLLIAALSSEVFDAQTKAQLLVSAKKHSAFQEEEGAVCDNEAEMSLFSTILQDLAWHCTALPSPTGPLPCSPWATAGIIASVWHFCCGRGEEGGLRSHVPPPR